MSQTGKQNPLGVNVNGSILQDIGLRINAVAQSYMGASKTNTDYSFGSLVQSTCLRLLTWSIHDAYNRGVVLKTPAGTSVYDNLITIGQGVSESLGNSKPPSYIIFDPSGRWSNYGSGTHKGPATTGYYLTGDTGQGQNATWVPYLMTNNNHSVTQWGFIRCWALQAWNEFNWNGIPAGSGMPEYKDFTSSFLTANSFVDYSNVAINALKQSQTFLKGTYSNMNDLISSDITGVSLATNVFGQDCIALGKAIDLTKIQSFGLPSVLLQTIKKYNTITQSLSVALLSAGLETSEIENISKGTPATKDQEQKIYGAFLIIVGQDLIDILIPLNVKTQGLETLADLLNVKKIFPNSYKSLTVPIYNANPGPTNSKTYYPIYEGNEVSVRIQAPAIVKQIGTVIPPAPPPIIEPPALAPVIATAVENKPDNVTTTQVIESLFTPSPIVESTTTPGITGGTGGGCPAPWINITLANKKRVPAGHIRVGMKVFTKHEITGIWDDYTVTAVSSMTDKRWKLKCANGSEFVGTYNHRFLTSNGWKELCTLELYDTIICEHDINTYVTEVNAFDTGEVIKITVDDAHTYLTEGLVSHNVKILDFNDNMSNK